MDTQNNRKYGAFGYAANFLTAIVYWIVLSIIIGKF